MKSNFKFWSGVFNNTRGKFFTVRFIKNNGEKRTINAQLESLIDVANPSNSNYIVVKEADKLKKNENAYRKINVDTIQSFKCGKVNI